MNCERCESGPNQCLSCKANSLLSIEGTCKCIESTFYDAVTEQCSFCHESCQTCDRADTCLVCKEGFEKGDKLCHKCANNEYLTGDSCANCGPNCLTCASGPSQCMECSTTFALDNGNCICADGTYLEASTQNICLDCDPFCETCNGQANCLTCKQNTELVNGKCECLDGYFKDGTTCEKCGETC